MSSYLTVVTAEADAARRNAELLRDLEALRRIGPRPSGRPSLGVRLASRVLRRRRPLPAA
jgi:hypothetical protein